MLLKLKYINKRIYLISPPINKISIMKFSIKLLILFLLIFSIGQNINHYGEFNFVSHHYKEISKICKKKIK